MTFAFPKTFNPAADTSNQLSYWVIKYQMTFQHPRKNVTFRFDKYGESLCVKDLGAKQANISYWRCEIQVRFEHSDF